MTNKINLFTSTRAELLENAIDQIIKSEIMNLNLDSSILVILPRDQKKREKQRMLFDSGIRVNRGDIFHTFHSFASTFSNKTKYISDELSLVLLRRIVLSSTLLQFSEIKTFPGFTKCLWDMFNELNLSQITPEEFSSLLTDVFKELRDRDREIIALFKRYYDLKRATGYGDRTDISREGLEQFKKTNIRFRKLIVQEIYNLTPLQEELLKELIKRSDDVYIGLDRSETSTRTTRPVDIFIKSLKEQYHVTE
ncbi:MAG: hypothetical protein PHV06_10235, partial [bacterium]|nr:hypothetical protein [bacterium]